MDIEDSVRKGVEKGGRHQPHVSGQRNGVRSGRAQGGDHLPVEGFPVRKAFVIDAEAGQAASFCPFENLCPRTVAENQTDVRVQRAAFDGVKHGLRIGAASGSKNGKFESHGVSS